MCPEKLHERVYIGRPLTYSSITSLNKFWSHATELRISAAWRFRSDHR
jgi:hypothetical protein